MHAQVVKVGLLSDAYEYADGVFSMMPEKNDFLCKCFAQVGNVKIVFKNG